MFIIWDSLNKTYFIITMSYLVLKPISCCLTTKTLLKFTNNLLSAVPGLIPGGISVKDFSAITKTNDTESKKILESLLQSGIGTKSNDKYYFEEDRKSTRLNSSHSQQSRMPSSA